MKRSRENDGGMEEEEETWGLGEGASGAPEIGC